MQDKDKWIAYANFSTCQLLIHLLDDEYKKRVISEIGNSALSSFDFLLLVVLSCSIATLGLVSNSPRLLLAQCWLPR